jgi:hypothetical protein
MPPPMRSPASPWRWVVGLVALVAVGAVGVRASTAPPASAPPQVVAVSAIAEPAAAPPSEQQVAASADAGLTPLAMDPQALTAGDAQPRALAPHEQSAHTHASSHLAQPASARRSHDSHSARGDASAP